MKIQTDEGLYFQCECDGLYAWIHDHDTELKHCLEGDTFSLQGLDSGTRVLKLRNLIFPELLLRRFKRLLGGTT